jgi:quercetin dioxygenase-like cupin family protein
MTEPIDLRLLGAELLASTSEHHDGGRAARTVVHEPGLRATLIALRACHELAEHDAPPAASLFVVSGNVRLTTATNSTPLTAGQITPIPHERHALIADIDAIVLLTVRVD